MVNLHEDLRKKRLSEIANLLILGNEALAHNEIACAESCYRQALQIDPCIPEIHNNLGSMLKEQGQLVEAERHFSRALALRPSYDRAHSNWLFTQHYAAGQSMAGLRQAHEAWSKCHLQDVKPQTFSVTSKVSPVIAGLVSPDLYYHPVGVFLLPWLANHDRQRLRLIIYRDGGPHDWLAEQINAKADRYRTVSALDDPSLAKQIREDGIAILIDLAGHTAGNRLKLFARRAAPIQVSWLGYSSTTGVPAMDYILMDQYSAPVGYEEFFTEKLIRLDGLRFCYTPPPYAPDVSPAPTLTKSHITFGSFNNLAKITPEVIQCWTSILNAVPNSRLVLKWKSLGDIETRARLTVAFVQHGIEESRLECRGWSSHPAMLAEYADIDICLDPFPFSGGLTSCDALYMGVPVITVPGELSISRQTGSFLDAMGLDELIGTDQADYQHKAIQLASDRPRLSHLRKNLRQRMLTSRVCDATAYACTLDKTLLGLYLAANQHPNNISTTMPQKKLLNVGAGHRNSGAELPTAFRTSEWQEVRLDIDPKNEPDIIGSMLDMSAVASGSVDALYSSHNIEHLYPDEVPKAISEFVRVLKPEGIAVVTCPDLQAAAQMIAEDKLMDTAYESPIGPVTPFDIVYSHRKFTGRDKPFMAHHCGFTLKVLIGMLKAGGFRSLAGKRHPSSFSLWVVASKSNFDEAPLRELAEKLLPA